MDKRVLVIDNFIKCYETADFIKKSIAASAAPFVGHLLS